MPSAFERAVKSVIQEVDDTRELIPVDCLQNSTSFRLYCLLSRRLSSSPFWKPRYTCVNLSIKDILEPSAPEPEPQQIDRFQVSDVFNEDIQGSVALSGMAEGRISGGAAVSGSSGASMSVCLLRVSMLTWMSMQSKRHLQKPENQILQQLRSRGDDMFVISAVLQTEEEVQITQTHSREGSGQLTLPGASCSQGEGKGQQNQKKMVTIPAGSILAFQATQLFIGHSWGISLISDEDCRTFEPSSDLCLGYRKEVDEKRHCFNLRAALKLIDEISEEEEFRKDFKGLDAEVEAGSSELMSLEMELREDLLEYIGEILQDQPSLEALEATLGQGLYSGRQVEPMDDGPAGYILNMALLYSGKLVLNIAAPIFYLLGALNVLTETQRQLLAKALETMELSKQLELVKHVLEKSSPWQKQISVSLPSMLLGDSWNEEAPTWVLLEECGLRLQVEPPQVHWEPTSQGPTCALYASLAILSSLGQKPH